MVAHKFCTMITVIYKTISSSLDLMVLVWRVCVGGQHGAPAAASWWQLSLKQGKDVLHSLVVPGRSVHLRWA